MKDKRRQRIILITSAALLAAAAAVLLCPTAVRAAFSFNREALNGWIASFGKGGVAVLLAVQAAQVVVAFIPGEPVELIAGALYGGWGGLVLCLLGSAAASAAIFALCKRYGTGLASRLFKKKKLEEYAFIKDSKRLEAIVFTVFLMPGTPKDLLTYVVGSSPMKLSRFIVLTTLARIPSVASSTFIGSAAREGDWGVSAAIFLVTAAVGLTGIFARERAVAFCRRISKKGKG